MAIELAMEDDPFFVDLNRHISLLIDDEDDLHVSHFSSFSTQEFQEKTVEDPPKEQANWGGEKSKGTGVFIPESSLPRRKYRQHLKRQTLASSYSANKTKKITPTFIGRSNVASHPNYTTTNNSIR